MKTTFGYYYNISIKLTNKNKLNFAAWLSKTKNGEDYGDLVRVGEFSSEESAKTACKKHFEKACKTAESFNRPIPFLVGRI